MRISAAMVLFWVAIVLVPIVVSITAIGIVPNDQSVPLRWDDPGLVHGGSPTKIMIVAMVLATGNVVLAGVYMFNNNLDLPELVHGVDKKEWRVASVIGAILFAAAGTFVAMSWSQALISTLY